MTWGGYEQRARSVLEARERQRITLPPRFLDQVTHLTCPATVWRYVEGAVTRSQASLVMLDLEDSIPRGDEAMLERGRSQVIRALQELDWARKLRFFRPRGVELDPGFSDVLEVVQRAGGALDGIIYPKVDGPEEVKLLDEVLGEAEAEARLERGALRVELLIESVAAERRLGEIARSTPRLAGLILGAFDYWSTLGLSPEQYSPSHPLLQDLRVKLVKEAALVGVPAIAEMTPSYPTRDKPEAERAAALEQCRQDAELAREMGFAGKWIGIPAQGEVVHEVFRLTEREVSAAIEGVRAYREAERAGRGAVMIEGQMTDRATDRINRGLLLRALSLGQLDPELARELELTEG